jgi:hypothetical protein
MNWIRFAFKILSCVMNWIRFAFKILSCVMNWIQCMSIY